MGSKWNYLPFTEAVEVNPSVPLQRGKIYPLDMKAVRRAARAGCGEAAGGYLVTLRVPVNPELLHWALRRSGRTPEGLSSRFKKLGDWLEGRVQPTLNQLEDFARATNGRDLSWSATHE